MITLGGFTSLNINRTRDYYFDNLRGFLILMVIIGNSLEYLYIPYVNTHYFLLFLYLFHMPMLTFISGYFCKKSKRSTIQKVKDTTYIYLFAQIFYFIFNKIILESTQKFQLLYPNWTLWYLLALIVWYILSDYINDYKKAFITSISLALLIGFDTSIGSFASISRIFFFFPFFIAGMSFNKNMFLNKYKKYTWLISLFTIVILSVLYIFRHTIELEYFFEYTSYTYYLDSPVIPFLIRIFHYIGAFTLLSFFMLIFTSKKSLLSWIGKNSLILYVSHSGIITIMSKDYLEILHFDTLMNLTYSILLIVLAVIIFSYVYIFIKEKLTSTLFLKIGNRVGGK